MIPRLSVIESPNAWLRAASEIETTGLQSVEEFLAKVPAGAREAMQLVLDWWTSQPGGAVRHGARTAISLDRPHPTHPSRPLSHIVFNDNGTYTINRSYLVDAGLVPPDAQADFDAMLNANFPDLGWTAKKYFLTGRAVPSVAAVEVFVDWLDVSSGGQTKSQDQAFSDSFVLQPMCRAGKSAQMPDVVREAAVGPAR